MAVEVNCTRTDLELPSVGNLDPPLNRPLKILQVNTRDTGGGAEKISYELMKVFQHRGHNSWLAVGNRRSKTPGVFQVPNDRYRSQNARIWLAVAKLITPLTSYSRLAEKIQDWLSWRGQRQRLLNIQAGYEDFDFPGTSRILALTPEQADILHLHNLHGNYFDLSQLPDFCGHLPVFITMHDAWLLSGHCAHSFDCNLWQRGCGNCPDLTIYPSLTRDQTAFCWQRKEAIYAHSDIYLATPCNWLMSRVKQSMLWQSVRDARVIPYGVDLTVFNESERQFAKRRLRIPEGGIVLLFVSHGIRQNPWKDYQTLRRAIEQISQMYPSKEITFLALGETSKEEKIGMARIRFIPYTTDVSVVARYYCAADVYVHAAHQDTFPNTILEALACGTPVVATAVGGIPEQIRDGVTGLLTPAGDPESLARSIVRLIQDQDLRTRMSHNAAEYARKYFNIERQADDYLKWYYQVLTNNDSSMIDE